MSRILLVSSNKCEFPYAVFPLGMAMVDAALQRAGHQTRWHDCQHPTATLEQEIEAFAPDAIGISLRNIDDVVFKRRETYFGALIDLAKSARAVTNCPIILGGSGFSIFPEKLLELSGADFGIQGEGEENLPKLLETIGNPGGYDAVPGLVFRKGDRIVVNPRGRGATPSVDLPSRPPAQVDYYLGKSSMLNVQTQRGCVFECCYCTYPHLEGRFPRRSQPETIADELAELDSRGVRYVFVVDSVFNSSPAHVLETCTAIAKRGLKLKWGCFLRPSGLDREQMDLLAAAGLAHIEFGTDSFSDPVLAAYGKRFRFEDVLNASQLANDARIDYCHFLICGGPGETDATLVESFENSQKLPKPVILALAGMRVYPGTPLYERARSENVSPASDALLEPHYYFSPGMSAERVAEHLAGFADRSPNWIVTEPSPEYFSMAERLRKKGVVGPLWAYLAMLQRIVPVRR